MLNFITLTTYGPVSNYNLVAAPYFDGTIIK